MVRLVCLARRITHRLIHDLVALGHHIWVHHVHCPVLSGIVVTLYA